MRKLFFITSVFAFLFCHTLVAQELVILHTNDTHSHIEPIRSGKDAGLGGVIERAAYVDSVRKADGVGNVLLMDAGDFSQGSSYFTLLKGDVEVDVMNAMRYDVACLGNHEFDNGLDELARRLRNINFPVVCANYDFSGSPVDGLVEPYAILRRGGLKIGVIGLLTDISKVVDRRVADQFEYLDPVDVTNRYAALLKNKKDCDIVICLTHLGYEGEFFTDVQLASQIRNVDLIVGGHSHTFLKKAETVENPEGNDISIVTDGRWGLNIGKINLKSEKREHLLSAKYDAINADTLFRVGAKWFPYPEYEDREGWKSLFGESAQQVIAAADKIADYKWQVVPASAYLAYERTGDRAVMQDPQGANRKAMIVFMLAELAEGKGRFLDQIIDGLWMSSYLPTWVLSAHNPRQSSHRALSDPREVIIDLGSGGYGAYMALAYHFFHRTIEKIDPSINYSIEKAVKEKILDPYMDESVRVANWWTSEGYRKGQIINNWNPWCNSNVILCYLLMEKDQKRLSDAMRFSVESVDRFIEFVKEDGACEEGPSYWGHAAGKLYDFVNILYDASEGKYSVFDNEQIRAMGEYISRSYIGNNWVVNFADATASLKPDTNLLYRYGKSLGSSEMTDFAMYLLYDQDKGRFRNPALTMGDDAYRTLESVRSYGDMKSRRDELQNMVEDGIPTKVLASLRNAVPASTWYPETEFAYFRNNSNWFFAAKGGFNNESHNHNDVGTFVLYIDNTPILVDAGVGTYTKKTFSPERYTIWTMQSEYHNLPMINGVAQKYGQDYKASDVSCNLKSRIFSADIATAYPEDASCKSWIRRYVLKEDALHIKDSYELDCRKAADIFHFLIHGQAYLPGSEFEINGQKHVVKKGNIVISASGHWVVLSYPTAFEASLEEINLGDPRLTKVWGETLRRIELVSSDNAPVKGSYNFTVRLL